MSWSYLVILRLLAVTVAAFVVKDSHPAPRGWRNVGRAPADHVLNLRIGLTQSNFVALERQLYEVSDPKHPRYGQHLSVAEVNDLVRPADLTISEVEQWLDQSGIDVSNAAWTPAKTWLSLPVSVADAERLLNTKYSVWQHDDASILIRTQSYSLPLQLHRHISTIQPTNAWSRLNRRVPVQERSVDYLRAPANLPDVPLPADSTVAAACNFSAVTIKCLRTLYGTIDYRVSNNSDSKLGITDYLEEYNNRSDTYQFLEMYRKEAANAAYTFTQISIAGGQIDTGVQTANEQPTVGLEGNLDSEFILGVGYPLPLTAFSTGGRDESYVPSLSTPEPNSDEPFLTWANYITSQFDVPQMISTSYGDDEQTVSRAYAQAVCNEFAQLGARGVSLLFASGDAGVGADGTCYSNTDNTTYEFLPSFPNDCPYVTNVGGTRNYPEVAADLVLSDGSTFASGAGFSNYFEAPSYQKQTVDKYVAELNGLYDGFYNKSGELFRFVPVPPKSVARFCCKKEEMLIE